MRLPATPPDFTHIIATVVQNEHLLKYLSSSGAGLADPGGSYYHWDKLRFLESKKPPGLSFEEWWACIKLCRVQQYREVAHLSDQAGSKFTYCITRSLEANISRLTMKLGGNISTDIAAAINPQIKNTYMIRSSLEESISSSQLEGAVTTRKVAKDMIRNNNEPKDHSQRMIFNNYMGMEFVKDHSHEELTPELICELHRIMTENTLEAESDAGKYRSEKDNVVVAQNEKVLFTPPKASVVSGMIQNLCHFVNEDDNDCNFINPLTRAIITHFLLAYIHPFVDGNGRTARALFYWVALKKGFWLAEFISISKVIQHSKSKYSRSFLLTETDSNDLTYFILHQVDVINQAVEAFEKYIKKTIDDISEAQKLLKNEKIRRKLNFRQLQLIRHGLDHPGQVYTVASYVKTHGVTYETGRRDLTGISDELGILIKVKQGKSFSFFVPNDLKSRILELSETKN